METKDAKTFKRSNKTISLQIMELYWDNNLALKNKKLRMNSEKNSRRLLLLIYLVWMISGEVSKCSEMQDNSNPREPIN